MPLQLLTEHETTANLSAGWTLVNQLEATALPTRFGVTAQFVGAITSGNMELSVEILTTANVSFGTHTVTAARVTTGGSPNRGRVEFDKLFYLPAGHKAKFKLKSVNAGETSVNTDIYVYDPNHATAAAESRLTATPTISTGSTDYISGDAVGGQMSFSVGSSRGTIIGCRILDQHKQSKPFELWLFRASTTNGTNLADTYAFNPSDTQLANLVGVLRINDWFDAGNNSIGQAENLPLAFAGLSGTTLYGWLVTRGTPDFNSSSDLIVELDVLKE